MSYHAGISIPPLMVTARSGACGKDEAHAGQLEVGDDGLEVVAVRAQAVQPDHRPRGLAARPHLDARQQGGHR